MKNANISKSTSTQAERRMPDAVAPAALPESQPLEFPQVDGVRTPKPYKTGTMGEIIGMMQEERAKQERQRAALLESWIWDTETPANIGTEIVLEELVAELKDIVSMVASSLGGTGWDRGTPTSDPL